MILSVTQRTKNYDIAIIGAGPAGLTAAYSLAKAGKSVIVLEKDPEYVGGLSKTFQYKGYYFDVGGHRFYTQIPRVQKFWNEILPHDFLIRPRKSHIYYRGKLIKYPLSFKNIFTSLSLHECISILFSYFGVKVSILKEVKSYQDYIEKNFGPALFKIFFKGYTEKIWGRPCSEISKDWAMERIGKLSISKIFKEKFFNFNKKTKIKTLINEFYYPKYGPGMFWEECARKFQQLGGELVLDAQVKKLKQEENWQLTFQKNNSIEMISATKVINTAPLKITLDILGEVIPPQIKILQNKIKYRSFIQVALITDAENEIKDTWQYIQDEKFLTGRIQNFKNWSPYLVPDPSKTCYGVELFCNQDDDLWNSSDQALMQLAKTELSELGIIKNQIVHDFKVIKVPFAYPIYTLDYKEYIQEILKFLESHLSSFYTIGRNGCHQYNNQDHSSMNALEIVDIILDNSLLTKGFIQKERSNYLEERLNSNL